MKIQVLYFDECPHAGATLAMVQGVVSDLRLDAEIDSVKITDREEAQRHNFLGSPTVRVDGVDIDPSARERKDYVLGCRLYGASGTPPRKLVEAALRRGKDA